jgi:hypothetical protein
MALTVSLCNHHGNFSKNTHKATVPRYPHCIAAHASMTKQNTTATEKRCNHMTRTFDKGNTRLSGDLASKVTKQRISQSQFVLANWNLGYVTILGRNNVAKA